MTRSETRSASGRVPAALALNPNLVDDIFPGDVLARLAKVADFPARPITSPNDLPDGTEVLVTGWGSPVIDADLLETVPSIRAVVHAAGSVKPHVRLEVLQRGVIVSSAASANATPVSEYTLAMIVLAAKGVFEEARHYASGTTKPGYPSGDNSGAFGATVGVIGASRIGRQVIDGLPGIGATALVADPYVSADDMKKQGAELVSLDELCRRSDVVTVHAPKLPETRHLLDADRLAQLRDGAVVINTARGALVDTEALAAECASGRLSAVLDVTEPEPLPSDHPLFAMPNVLVTPHMAGARGRELRRLGEFAVAEVERLVRDVPLQGLVHADDWPRIA